MARSTPPTQSITADGLAANMTAPNADGDIAECGGGYFMTVDNGSGVSVTVTVQTPDTFQGLAIADRIVTVAAGATKDIPLPQYYRQPLDAVTGPGKALVDFSAVASVTRAVKKLAA
ncbi:hypothetical protein ACIRG5_42330 [Lentzea sp. NPDC102401]|uniref:hypothetical protein n=1 Tax=Lentzea sp. NPDC102401 TaxID=3364128 RepID=UPI0037FCF501